MKVKRLTDLAYLTEKELATYYSKEGRVRVGEYYINEAVYGNLIFKVLGITHDKVFLTDSNVVVPERYSQREKTLRSDWDKLTKKFLDEKLKFIRSKELEKMLSNGTIKRYQKFVDTVLKSIFPEELFELELKENGKQLDVTIRFPELLLTSENGLTHTLRDLFVKIPMIYLSGNIRLGQLRYARTTFEVKEVISSYVHSHLNSGCFSGFSSNFCYGSTVFSAFLNTARSSFDIRDLYVFLQNLTDFLKWESISGTPYKYISNLGDPYRWSSNTQSVQLPSETIYSVVENVYKEVISKINFSDEIYEFDGENITFTERFYAYMISLIREACPKELFFQRNRTGMSVTTSDSLDRSSCERINGTESDIIFKGARVKYKILGIDDEEDDETSYDNKFPHHFIEGEVLMKLFKKIKGTLIEEYYERV